MARIILNNVNGLAQLSHSVVFTCAASEVHPQGLFLVVGRDGTFSASNRVSQPALEDWGALHDVSGRLMEQLRSVSSQLTEPLPKVVPAHIAHVNTSRTLVPVSDRAVSGPEMAPTLDSIECDAEAYKDMQWLAEVSRWLEEKRLENDQASDWLVGALTVVSDHLQEVLCNATHPLGEKVVEFTRRQSVQLKEIESSDLTSLVELIITFAMALHSLVIQRFKLLNSCAELTTAVYFPIHRVLLEPLYIPLYKLHSQECKHKDAEWSAAVVALHAVGPQELGVSAKFCFDAVSVKSASQPRPRPASTEGIINEDPPIIFVFV